jgi:hypothetical protein
LPDASLEVVREHAAAVGGHEEEYGDEHGEGSEQRRCPRTAGCLPEAGPVDPDAAAARARSEDGPSERLHSGAIGLAAGELDRGRERATAV